MVMGVGGWMQKMLTIGFQQAIERFIHVPVFLNSFDLRLLQQIFVVCNPQFHA